MQVLAQNIYIIGLLIFDKTQGDLLAVLEYHSCCSFKVCVLFIFMMKNSEAYWKNCVLDIIY